MVSIEFVDLPSESWETIEQKVISNDNFSIDFMLTRLVMLEDISLVNHFTVSIRLNNLIVGHKTNKTTKNFSAFHFEKTNSGFQVFGPTSKVKPNKESSSLG